MKLAARLTRYVALKTYGPRQEWAYFKEDFTELRQYWSFRFRMRISKGWPFHPLARLLSRGLENSQGFGKFDGKKDGLPLPAEHPIFDKKNDRLFNKEAALRAFEHVKVEKIPGDAAEQTEAEELTNVRSQVADAISAMQAQEARRVARLKTIIGVVLGVLIVLAVVLFVG